MIYHLTTREAWHEQQSADFFTAPSLQTEGFIHCSTCGQVAGVRERYFSGQRNLVLLHIDEAKLTCEVKYEVSTGGEKFPHVYGPVDRAAIVVAEQLAG